MGKDNRPRLNAIVISKKMRASRPLAFATGVTTAILLLAVKHLGTVDFFSRFLVVLLCLFYVAAIVIFCSWAATLGYISVGTGGRYSCGDDEGDRLASGRAAEYSGVGGDKCNLTAWTSCSSGLSNVVEH